MMLQKGSVLIKVHKFVCK